MSLQSADPLVGRRFGNYVVEKPLGSGGMGAVYQALQPEIGKRVAIKFLAPELTSDPQVVQRFFAEARAVNLIQHENIVDIFDFRAVDGLSYFVMELLPGSSLSSLLSREPSLPVGRTLAIAVQVAAAIAAAHAHRIVHRDLKPDNIFLTPKAGYDDFVKVLDFGIAKLTRAPSSADLALPQTLRGMVMGTPGYMSPEQGTGDTVDERTDVYALGVLIHRMLAGRLPFEGRTFEEILKAQLADRPPLLSSLRADVPPALSALVRELIERNPAKRPALMREVQERLVAILRTVGPTPSGRLQPIGDGWRSVPPTRLRDSERLAVRPKRPALVHYAALGGVAVASATLAVWIFWRPASHVPATIAPVENARPLPVASTPAPPTSAPPTNAPTTPVPASAATAGESFRVYLESNPPGAEIWTSERRLGTTPALLTLDHEQVLKLRKPGYHDEPVEVTRGTEHQLVPLQRAATARPRPRPDGKPTAPRDDGTGLGLND